VDVVSAEYRFDIGPLGRRVVVAIGRLDPCPQIATALLGSVRGPAWRLVVGGACVTGPGVCSARTHVRVRWIGR
jgi:hypothetical protein